MELLKSTLKEITAIDGEVGKLARAKWDNLVHPVGSLGMLEEITIKLASLTGNIENTIEKKAIVVMCADNGVVDEGISSGPQIFTRLLADAMAKELTGVSALAKHVNADVKIIDIGLNGEMNNPKVLDKKIANGTKNFVKEAAMSYEESIKSIEIGIEIGDQLFKEGYDILGTGELGIGNTTTAAAVVTALTDLNIDITCGKGAGLTDEQFHNKKQVILKGIELNKPNVEDPVDVIAKVGGFDIGGMCGLFLSAAKNKRPIVIDGYISSAAALSAVRLNPLVKDYLFPSHLSKEPGAMYVMDELGLKPFLTLEMRLGEGSGCPLAFQVIESAIYAYENMGTFEETSIQSNVLVNIRED